uniref:Integrase catalytic domain-containing protein n=1 Tax=Peronospora matthiolae TaxID=2874970 RepID=A0AAV1TEW2_9STRA
MAGGKERTVKLTEVYIATELERDIVSYGKLELKGFGLVYDGATRSLANRSNGEVAFYLTMENNLLYVKTVETSHLRSMPSDVLMAILAEEGAAESSFGVQSGTLMHFHQRLGHLPFDTVERMAKDPASGIKLTDRRRLTCLSCAEGKQTKNSQSQKDTGVNAPIDRIGGVICSDPKGPMTPKDRHGNRYLVNFIDHKSNYCRVFLAPTKDQAAKKIEHFLVFFEKRFNCRIHVLRTDGGGEYQNVDLFCKRTGVARQVSEARNQASNGKAERMHRTVLNMARSIIFASHLPLTFWGDAVEYAAYILNRSPTSANLQRASPIQVLTKVVPDLRNIVVFGSSCTVYRDPRKNSLAQRSKVGIIVGRSDEAKGYGVFLQQDNIVVVTQHVKNIATLSDEQNEQLQRALEYEDQAGTAVSRSAESSALSMASLAISSKQKKNGKLTVRSGRLKKKSWTRSSHGTRGASKRAQKFAGQEEPASNTSIVNHVYERYPKNYGEAMRSSKSEDWKKAMCEELEALENNDVWHLIKRPSSSNALHTKWVYKTKMTADGDFERLKARLVACGNEQVFGVDYGLTFAAVMDMSTVKIILALAVTWGVVAKHGDIPNAYVKADKEADLEILLQVRRGMDVSSNTIKSLGASSVSEMALQLRKSLYGLKQAGRLWIQLLHARLFDVGFQQCVSDMCFYWKKDGRGLVIVGVYVDDLLATGTDAAAVDRSFASLGSLSIKDLGAVNKFLEMRVEVDNDGDYIIDQEVAINDILKDHGLEDANSTRMQIVTRSRRQTELCLLMQKEELQAFEASNRSSATRQTHQPRFHDYKLAKRIARYLQGTCSFKLRLTPASSARETVSLESYSDADFAADKLDRKSLTGGVIFLNGMAMLREIGMPPGLPMTLYIDNQAATKKLDGEASSLKAKHIDVRLKFVRDYSRREIIQAQYVRSEAQVANLMTMALDAAKLASLCELMSLG